VYQRAKALIVWLISRSALNPKQRPAVAYSLAFLCAAIATALGVAIDPYVVGVPFVTFSPAVIITALISGFGAGVFCGILSAASATFFLLPPRWSFYVESPADVVELLVFIFEAFFYVIIIAGIRLSLEQYREISRNLEQRVEERSAALRESQHRLVSVVAELQHRTRNLIKGNTEIKQDIRRFQLHFSGSP
jgi:K+-sensing histidine kinase KdpD